MITAVIDTHGLLNSIPKNSEKRWLYDSFLAKQFVWVFSNEILSEYAEMVAIEFSEKAMQSVVSILLTAPNTNRFDPFFKWQLVEADPNNSGNSTMTSILVLRSLLPVKVTRMSPKTTRICRFSSCAF